MTINIFKPNNNIDFRLGIAYYFRNKNEYCEFNEFYDVDSIGQHNNINSHTKISTWDTSNVTNTSGMFSGASSFNENLYSFLSINISINKKKNNVLDNNYFRRVQIKNPTRKINNYETKRFSLFFCINLPKYYTQSRITKYYSYLYR